MVENIKGISKKLFEMSFYELQLDRKSTRSYWRLSKRRENCLSIYGDILETKITYDYDTKGNLISATDQLGNTMKFSYLDTPNAPEHYLDTIINSFNQTNEFYQIRQPLKNHSILQTHNIKI